MNFFKSIAAVAVATATTFAAVEPAKAQEGGTQLLQSLQTAGVTFDTGACEAGVAGFYVPSKKHIRICDDATNGWETMRHEAVHAAQHCAGVTTLETLYSKADINGAATSKLLGWISDNYPEAHYWLEAEAYLLEDASNFEVAELVHQACG